MSLITDLFTGGAAKLVDSVKGLIDDNTTNDEERLIL